MSKGQITFWEGNGATQDRVGDILSGGESYDIECKNGDYNFVNDEIRSMKLEGIPGPTIIWVYDSPSAEKDDDWAKVTITNDVNDSVIVSSFNSSADLDNGNVKVESYYKNGLDGKISRIMIEYLG
ncbi:hypothetical protein [Spartinivicinus poritis]|uniref:Uncharacterized protein n=1 Tax=Spartinivicinus poritis TaxID=2994640 RepID=A0ABT5U6C5_9GAMM|nr:hypothetical protein [Spartinivicinus sp. A2-2]MDE1461112.1 hypothetical protein [Spartinivicinus sp. A2-2]